MALDSVILDFDGEAIKSYMGEQGAFAPACEYANAVAQHEEIDYRKYLSSASDLETRVGETMVEEYGFELMSDEELSGYFDYKAFGERESELGDEPEVGRDEGKASESTSFSDVASAALASSEASERETGDGRDERARGGSERG